MRDQILVANAGSSSLKFHVYDVFDNDQLCFAYGGQISGIGDRLPHFRVRDAQGQDLLNQDLAPDQALNLHSAQHLVADWLIAHLPKPPIAVGHRIVHGGTQYSASVAITPDVIEYLDGLSPLAPLHQRNNLAPVKVIMDRWPDIYQVACFDTAFHQGHDPVVSHFAIPKAYYERGVRRYGFHGLSYQYISQQLHAEWPDIYAGRVLVAHLGSGASACSLKAGRSVDTSMGFTALDGVPMGTRPGKLDAGVLLWMMEQGMTHDQIQSLLYTESGLKGLSGISADMRVLCDSDETQAQLAVDHFCFRVAETLAGLCVSLGGVDALVFTAGIGEHSPFVRAAIADRLAWLGVHIDPAKNESSREGLISTADSAVKVLVLPTNEELVIAQESLRLIRAEAGINI
ncbi:acetate/propionate family kinase [Alcaligenes endophyticus]|uniref:Acetate kinase n=1 Tax=Alcaligenes endophyticus TaxID=1929088 RepID=A0ABT8EMH1_9BURK|nr:acetate/propionate family kinase [Alcaligenes endophyticus]MCX5590945.1 acetate/propionate family kinase [Alcaligenes endophyticus]MDN4122478.1 acetate/propionate family kinase [Alcaligenes endophyticus]